MANDGVWTYDHFPVGGRKKATEWALYKFCNGGESDYENPRV
jgi:hypothetical protein